MYGEYDVDGFEDEIIDENDVLVLTPEKLDLIIRENEGFAEQIALIIIDEGHIVGSGARGIRSEFLINRVRHLSEDIRALFVSAVFSDDDLDIMNKWLKDSIIANSNWKPTTLHQGFFQWRDVKASDEKLGIIQFLDLYGEKIAPSFYTKVLTNKIKNQITDRMNKYPGSILGTSASLAIYFQHIGQTIVFCARKRETERITEEILVALEKYYQQNTLNIASKEDKELTQIIKYLQSYFSKNSLMIRALKKGIAFHHADLPDEVRQIIEKAFSEGRIKILCCTTTLAQGVNLPANNVIVHSVNHYRDQQKEINLTVKDYWNICGRAGRAYQSTEGNVIFVPQPTLFRKYKNPQNIETSISAFSSLLLNLEPYHKVMKDALSKRFNVNSIYNGYEEQREDNTESLLSQLVALLCEEIVDDEDVSLLVDFFKETLLYYEVSENNELINEIASDLFDYIKEISEKYGKEKLKLYYSTGLNVESCETLENEAIVLMQHIIDGSLDDEEVNTKIIDISFSVNELMPSFEHVSLKGSYNMSDAIIKWIEYSPLDEVKDYFIFEDDMQFYNFINRTFIQKAPWGIHSFIRLLESTFEENDYDLSDYLPEYKYIASKVKYGVNDIPAIFVCSLGIQNRNIAEKLAGYYIAEGMPNEYKTFKKWFCELMTEDIMEIFDYSLDDYSLSKITEIRNKTKYNSKILELRKAGIKSIKAKVVGMFYEDRYKYVYNLEKGEELVLKREIDNRFDPYAVEVYTDDDNKIGYIERQYANYISTYLDRGYKYECIICKITHPNPPDNYGKIQVQIELIR
jgi:replicative superfamily II helicase